jgi:hypothetical protein
MVDGCFVLEVEKRSVVKVVVEDVQCARLERGIYRAAEEDCKQAAQAWRGAFATSLFDIAPPSCLACESHYNFRAVSLGCKTQVRHVISCSKAKREAFQKDLCQDGNHP